MHNGTTSDATPPDKRLNRTSGIPGNYLSWFWLRVDTGLNLLGGGQLMSMVPISNSPEATSAAADQMPIALNQTLERAGAGKQVEMVVDLNLREVQAGHPLNFEIQRGSIGQTTVTLMKMIAANPEVVKTATWAGITDNVINPYTFSVPSELFSPGTP